MAKRTTKQEAGLDDGTGNNASRGRKHRPHIGARNLSLRNIGIHDEVRTAYEAFELLNPATADRPAEMPIRSLHCVARLKPHRIDILTGFHDYRRIPRYGEVQCFAEPPDSHMDGHHQILGWDYVFATTPWHALSNKVLSQFYWQFSTCVPAKVLNAHVPPGHLRGDFSELTPTAMELLSGISRKTLHRLRKASSKPGLKHLSQQNLPTRQPRVDYE